MPMDTINDNIRLNEMWDNNEALWKSWESYKKCVLKYILEKKF